MIKNLLINPKKNETYLVEDNRITYHHKIKPYHIFCDGQNQSILLLNGRTFIIADIDYDSHNNNISYKIINHTGTKITVLLQTELEQYIAQWQKKRL